MLQKLLRTQLPGFLSGVLFCLITSCAGGPKIRIYLSDPKANGMEYYDETTGASGFVNYGDTEKFICTTPDDFQRILTYCGVKK